MAVMEKIYNQNQSVLLNVLFDIAEMRKTSVKRLDQERFLMDTEMYGRKIPYIFRIVPAGEGTSVTVENEGEKDYAGQGVELMFAIIENLLSPFGQVK